VRREQKIIGQRFNWRDKRYDERENSGKEPGNTPGADWLAIGIPGTFLAADCPEVQA